MKPALARANKAHELFDRRTAGELALDPLDRLARVQPRLDEQAIRLLERFDLTVREPLTLETNGVDPVRLRVRTFGLAEREHVLAALRVAPDEGAAADPGELVHGGKSGDHRVISDLRVPGERRAVREHGRGSVPAVVGDVGVRHEVVVVPDDRLPRPRGRPPVDGRELAERVARSHDEPRRLPVVLQVLRLEPENGMREHPVLLAEDRGPLELRVGADGGASAELHPFADDGVGPDGDSRAETRARRDDRGRVDVDRHGRSARLESSSASAQSAPPTLAVARHFESRLLIATISTSIKSWSPGTTGRRNLHRSIPVR